MVGEAAPCPPKTRTDRALPYVFGWSAVVAATMMALMARPVFRGVQPYVVYILPIMAVASYGGLWPGLVATGESALAIVALFLGGVLDVHSSLLLILFLLDGTCISWLGEQLQTAIRSSQRSHREAVQAHQSQERILRSISDAFGALDTGYRFVYANQNLAFLAGTSPEFLSGKEIWEAIPAFGAEAPRRALQQAFETRVPATFEIFVPQVNRWYETTAYPFESGLSLCSRDITPRREAERVLREAEERMRLAPEIAMVGTWTNDFQAGQFLCSRELEGIFGLPPGAFAGTEEAFLDLIHPSDCAAVQEAFARCKQNQAPFETEFRYCNGSEETRWMLIRGRGYADEAGRPSRLVGIAIDVTVQKRNEEKLRHTQRLETLGLLAGGIAHDFNNLLLVMMGNANLASRLLPDHHPARAPLEEIELASSKAANLTRQMLAYSGKNPVAVQPLQIATVIRDIERLIRSLIPKSVELRMELASDLPLIEADPGQMQQVIMNLVINASEAIPEGRPGTVWVRASSRLLTKALADGLPPGGNCVVIEVEDDGIGMDEATQAKIFEPFFTTKFLGRGLGLAAVLGIVRAHKGALRVESTPGKGTRFQVLIAAEPTGSKILPASRASVQDLHGNGLIIVADDEEPVRRLAGNILESHGYTVLLAKDGYTAVEHVRRCPHSPALVLLDLSMPGMSVQRTIEQFRFLRPELPILLSSGCDEGGVLAKFNNRRLFGFIHKPYTPSQLCEQVKAALAEASAMAGARSKADGSHAVSKFPPAGYLVQ
jgi:PAS domain S-box-containing protein